MLQYVVILYHIQELGKFQTSLKIGIFGVAEEYAIISCC
jgi:hypothetical protein